MICLVAVDNNWAIGYKQKLIYYVPEDLKFFKETTIGKTIVCGRKTLESFPNSLPLPKRNNIVLTGRKIDHFENLETCESIEKLFEKISQIPEDEVFLCGGESVYRQLYKYCKKIIVTKILSETEGADSFFPNLDSDPDFDITEKSEIFTSSQGIRFQRITYSNKKGA